MSAQRDGLVSVGEPTPTRRCVECGHEGPVTVFGRCGVCGGVRFARVEGERRSVARRAEDRVLAPPRPAGRLEPAASWPRARRVVAPPERDDPRVAEAEKVMAWVARAYGLAVSDLVGPSKVRYVVRARQEAMQRVRSGLGLSFPVIGRLFGRDHSTVMYACTRAVVWERARARGEGFRCPVCGSLREGDV